MPRDGRVDNGRELFGNLTAQPASAHPNGFAALAVWDQPAHGGNGDGIIGPADAIWPRLRLSQDADHDGKVQPGELHTLASFGITGMSVHYRLAGGADRYGNRYGYAALVFGTGHAAALAYDFFLTTAPASPPGNDWPLAAGVAAAGAAVLADAALAIGRRRRARTQAPAYDIRYLDTSPLAGSAPPAAGAPADPPAGDKAAAEPGR